MRPYQANLAPRQRATLAAPRERRSQSEEPRPISSNRTATGKEEGSGVRSHSHFDRDLRGARKCPEQLRRRQPTLPAEPCPNSTDWHSRHRTRHRPTARALFPASHLQRRADLRPRQVRNTVLRRICKVPRTTKAKETPRRRPPVPIASRRRHLCGGVTRKVSRYAMLAVCS